MSQFYPSPLFLDNSILSSFAKCSTQAAVRYLLHRVPLSSSTQSTGNLPLLSGQAIHSALAAYLSGEEEESVIVQYGLDPAVANLPWDDLRSADSLSFTWDSWREIYANRFFGPAGFFSIPSFPTGELGEDGKPLLSPIIEKPLSATLSSYSLALFKDFRDDSDGLPLEVRFFGLLDLLARENGSGQLAVIDHKTTGSNLTSWYESSFVNSSQLKGYLWLASQQAGWQGELAAAWIHAIQLHRRPVMGRKCREHSLPSQDCAPLHLSARLLGPFSFSPRELEDWQMQALRLTTRILTVGERLGLSLSEVTTPQQIPVPPQINEIALEGQFGYRVCSSCPVSGWCRRGRDPEELERSTAFSPWTPSSLLGEAAGAEE